MNTIREECNQRVGKHYTLSRDWWIIKWEMISDVKSSRKERKRFFHMTLRLREDRV